MTNLTDHSCNEIGFFSQNLLKMNSTTDAPLRTPRNGFFVEFAEVCDMAVDKPRCRFSELWEWVGYSPLDLWLAILEIAANVSETRKEWKTSLGSRRSACVRDMK